MMQYRCLKCNQIFDESEIETESWREYRGECFGFPSYETMYEERCPHCGSTDFEEYFEEDEE